MSVSDANRRTGVKSIERSKRTVLASGYKHTLRSRTGREEEEK